MTTIHELALDHTAVNDGGARLELSGQENAIRCYKRLRYEIATGERYLDENMWHKMDMHHLIRRAEG